jgi:hypothetical protein
MPSLSPKENYLRAMRHEKTEYVPCAWGQDVDVCGMLPPIDYGIESTNYGDGFEDVITEVERCFREYGDKKRFIFAGGIVNSKSMRQVEEKNAAIIKTADRIRFSRK